MWDYRFYIYIYIYWFIYRKEKNYYCRLEYFYRTFLGNRHNQIMRWEFPQTCWRIYQMKLHKILTTWNAVIITALVYGSINWVEEQEIRTFSYSLYEKRVEKLHKRTKGLFPKYEYKSTGIRPIKWCKKSASSLNKPLHLADRIGRNKMV